MVNLFTFNMISKKNWTFVLATKSNIALVSVHGMIDGTTSLREGDIAVSAGRRTKVCFARSCLWSKSVDGRVYVPYRLSNEYSKLYLLKFQYSLDIFRIQKKSQTVHVPFVCPVQPFKIARWPGDEADTESYGEHWERNLCEVCSSHTPARFHRHSAKVWVSVFALYCLTLSNMSVK